MSMDKDIVMKQTHNVTTILEQYVKSIDYKQLCCKTMQMVNSKTK